MAIKRPKLKFLKGNTYVIDQSDASNANHPLRFTADSGATEYTHGVTATGTPGQAGATVTFNVPDSAPENIMYYCTTHGIGMGNHLKTMYDPSSVSYRGTRAWGNGGSRGDVIGGTYAGPVGGGSTDVHYFDIVTRSNSTEVGGILSYLPDVNNASGGWSTSSTTGSKAIVMGGARSQLLADDIYTFDTISLSNATSFGSTTSSYEGYQALGTANDGFRTVANTGRNPTNYTDGYDKLYYITNAQQGDATSFGDLTYTPNLAALTNDATRGIICGGQTLSGTSSHSTINYITIQTVGNAASQGSLSPGFRQHTVTSDETYAVQVGGWKRVSGIPALHTTEMNYFSIQSLATATTFGYLNKGRSKCASTSDGTTGVMWGGDILSTDNSPNPTEWALFAEYFTIQTPGNATDFGFQLNNGGTNSTFGSGAAA